MFNPFKRFDSIDLWKKFTGLGVLFLVLIITPTLMYWHEANKSIASLIKEQEGLQPIRLILNIVQRTQQHRATAARFLLDSTIPKNSQRVKAEELEESIFSYESYLKKHPNTEHQKSFEKISDYWHSLHQKVARKRITFAENYEMHKTLLNMELDYAQSLIDYYDLSHDPSIDAYLINISLMRLPELIDSLARTRGYGIGLIIKGKASMDERAQLKAFMLVSEANIKEIDLAFRKLELLEQQKYASSYQHYQAATSHYEKMRDITQAEILDKEVFGYSRDNYYSQFNSAINGYYGCIHFMLDQLDVSLNNRINDKKHERVTALLCIILLSAVVLGIYIIFVRKLLLQLGGEPRYIADSIQAIARGDLDSEIEARRPDSLLANVKDMQEVLRQGDRSKSEYIATATHELKTPLSAISSTLSLAVNGSLGELPESAMDYLSVAQRNSLRLANLIDNVFDINKLSVSKLELDIQIQPLMPIIEDAQLSMAGYAKKHGVHIVMGPRFEYLLVKVDARRLRQVLKNLLSNAAKFSNKGDEIIINTSIHADKVRIDIIDHGCGISDELKEGLFQKYPQEIAFESNHGNGKGLGLVISKQLIEAMDGEIGCTSTLGIGSCFYIDLPLEEPNTE